MNEYRTHISRANNLLQILDSLLSNQPYIMVTVFGCELILSNRKKTWKKVPSKILGLNIQ